MTIDVRRATLARYLSADQREKRRILDRVVAASGAHRKSVIRALGDAVRANVGFAERVAVIVRMLRALPPAASSPAGQLLDDLETVAAEIFDDAEPVIGPRHPHQGVTRSVTKQREPGNTKSNTVSNPFGNVAPARVSTRARAKAKARAEVEVRSLKSEGTPAARAAREARAPRKIDEVAAAQLLASASSLLRIRCSPATDYGRRALAVAARRIAEGATPAELVEVCRIAAQRWERGDRWAPLRYLTYLWGASFPAILAGGAASGRAARAPTHRSGDDLARWERAAAATPAMPDRVMLLGPDNVPVTAANNNNTKREGGT